MCVSCGGPWVGVGGVRYMWLSKVSSFVLSAVVMCVSLLFASLDSDAIYERSNQLNSVFLGERFFPKRQRETEREREREQQKRKSPTQHCE